MTFVNKIHSRLCAWQEWRDWSPDGRRPAAEIGRDGRATAAPGTKTGKFVLRNREVFAREQGSFEVFRNSGHVFLQSLGYCQLLGAYTALECANACERRLMNTLAV